MKIIYEDIEMEFERYYSNEEVIKFIFKDDGVEFALWKSRYNRAEFGLNYPISNHQKKTNKLYNWVSKNKNLSQEAKELYDFLFKKSPLKVKLLVELGPDAYEKYK